MAYSAQSDLETEFGVNSVRQWAVVDGDLTDTAGIATRCTVAIVNADAEIDAALLGSRYSVPFGGTVPTLIKRISVLLAGFHLYTARGIVDAEGEDFPRSRLTWARKLAERMLNDLKVGRLRLSGTAGYIGSDPRAVKSPECACGPDGRVWDMDGNPLSNADVAGNLYG